MIEAKKMLASDVEVSEDTEKVLFL